MSRLELIDNLIGELDPNAPDPIPDRMVRKALIEILYGINWRFDIERSYDQGSRSVVQMCRRLRDRDDSIWATAYDRSQPLAREDRP